jgi:hypothetical protein
MSKRSSLVLLTWLLLLVNDAFYAALAYPNRSGYITPKEGWFQFTTPFPDTIINSTHIGRLILDPPAGKHGRAMVRPDGHIYFADGTRAKFFGTNVCFSAAYPNKSIAEKAAAQIAKQGFNIVRFHHFDDALTMVPGSNSSRRFNLEVLDKFDFFFAELKERGIYVAIDLYSIRLLKEGDSIPCWDTLNRSVQRIKTPFMFYPPAYALYRDYAESLLAHLNLYTGLAYKDESALVFIDPINEVTLLDQNFWDRWDDPLSDLYLPRLYKRGLKRQWNGWLSKTYHGNKDLIRAWSGSDTALGPELIKNGEYSDTLKGLPRFWQLNVIDTSAKASWGIEPTVPSSEQAAYVHVTHTAKYPWQVQIIQNRIPVIPYATYRFQFKAKANCNCFLVISTQRDRDPWTEYLRDSLTLTPSDTRIVRYMYSRTADTVQIVFSVGRDTGKIEIDGVQFSRSPNSHILGPGESLYRGNIRLISWKNRYEYPPNRIFDQMRYFYDKEGDFYKRISALLKDTLRVKALVTSSCGWANQLHQRCWSENVDVMDEHPYFDHPSFPNAPWDMLDFQITNRFFGENYPTIWNQSEEMLISPNLRTCFGKPMILSEWQHCSPNESRYVSIVPFSAYHALRDYDGMFNFSFADGAGSYALQHINHFFESSGDPNRFILLRMGALAFMRDVKPEDLERTPWQFYSLDSLISDVYAGNYWKRAVSSSPRDRSFKQFYWNSKQGTFILNTPGSKAFTGRTSSDTALLGGLCVIGGTDGAFAATKIYEDSTSVAFLVAALARAENTGMIWRDSTKQTGLVNWGGPPCLMEPVSYHTSWNADSLRVSKLNPSGEVTETWRIPRAGTMVPWTINTGTDSVPWYRVTAYRFKDSAGLLK